MSTLPRLIVVMGPAGCGKSTLGAALAERLSLPFLEGDALHPAENVAAMAAGQPLNDTMRAGWLDRLADRLRDAPPPGLVVSCSALKRIYRDRLRVAPVQFLFLDITPEEARRRVATRTGHFMPATLVDSQFDTLERPAGEPDVRTVDAMKPTAEVLQTCLKALS